MGALYQRAYDILNIYSVYISDILAYSELFYALPSFEGTICLWIKFNFSHYTSTSQIIFDKCKHRSSTISFMMFSTSFSFGHTKWSTLFQKTNTFHFEYICLILLYIYIFFTFNYGTRKPQPRSTQALAQLLGYSTLPAPTYCHSCKPIWKYLTNGKKKRCLVYLTNRKKKVSFFLLYLYRAWDGIKYECGSEVMIVPIVD